MSSATVRVEKATSDLLIGPDWTMNMEICDSINSDHWQAKDVLKAVKKRLQHKNPKVQFLALMLLETMIKNCGDYVHFQVVEREILQEMVKIVRKKTDMQVRDKILVLLDSWQEAFGGPRGKYPQYYWAYADLKRSGVEFPRRSPDSALIFTPPITNSRSIPIHPQAGYGMPSSSAIRLDEAMASEMGNLSLSDLDSIRSVMELLSDMLQAVKPNDREAVKDEVIMDLVSQCRTNQKRLMHLITSTGDEELLGQGLVLNDNLQSLLVKHDAIASGFPLPTEAYDSSPRQMTSVPSAPVTENSNKDEEEEEDDEFAQLARRNRPATAQSKFAASGDLEASPNCSDVTTATTGTTTSDASSSIVGNALALPDPPAAVRTSTKEQDMIDLLSITLSTNPSPPHTPLTPTPVPNQNESPISANPNAPGYPYSSQTYQGNRGYVPFNSYVAPWAQPQPLSPHPPPPQPLSPPQLQRQSQPQVPPYSSSYPPPPWATPASANPNPFESSTNKFPVMHTNVPASYVQTQAPRPLQPYNSSGLRGDNIAATAGQAQVNANQRQTGNTTAPRPFIPSYRLFEDLVDLRNADGRLKVSSGSPSLSGTSGQAMISGRK